MMVKQDAMSGEVSGGLPATRRRSREATRARADGSRAPQAPSVGRPVARYRPPGRKPEMAGSLRISLVAVAALALLASDRALVPSARGQEQCAPVARDVGCV